MKKKFECFSQRAFKTIYHGEEQVGIFLKQVFHPLWDAVPGQEIFLRELQGGGQVEYSYRMDGEHQRASWYRLPSGRPI